MQKTVAINSSEPSKTFEFVLLLLLWKILNSFYLNLLTIYSKDFSEKPLKFSNFPSIWNNWQSPILVLFTVNRSITESFLFLIITEPLWNLWPVSVFGAEQQLSWITAGFSVIIHLYRSFMSFSIDHSIRCEFFKNGQQWIIIFHVAVIILWIFDCIVMPFHFPIW